MEGWDYVSPGLSDEQQPISPHFKETMGNGANSEPFYLSYNFQTSNSYWSYGYWSVCEERGVVSGGRLQIKHDNLS